MKINKKQNDILEKERDMLKITLGYYAEENLNLKGINEDLKMTVIHNKEMLREYIDNITNKDKTVQKMHCLIDQLNDRLSTANDQIKKMGNQMNQEQNKICENCKVNSNETNSVYGVKKNERNFLTSNTKFQTYNKTENIESHSGNINKMANLSECNTLNNILYSSFPKQIFILANNNKDEINFKRGNKDFNPGNNNIQNHFDNCQNCKNYVITIKNDLINSLNLIQNEINNLFESVKVNNEKKQKSQINNISHNNSIVLNTNQLFSLNHSVLSNNSRNNSLLNVTDNGKSKKNYSILNFKTNYNIKKLDIFLTNSDNKSNLLLMKDNSQNFWELIKRKDITEINNNNLINIKSVLDVDETSKFNKNDKLNKSEVGEYSCKIKTNKLDDSYLFRNFDDNNFLEISQNASFNNLSYLINNEYDTIND